jgi:endonuclease/exonuclease/phosphatase (EEP) superfamily protein YafD
MIRQVLAEVDFNENDSYIFAGDFNTWSKRRTRYLNWKLKERKFTRVKFKNARYIKKFICHKLDHAYVRDVKVISAEVFNMKKASDHNPLSLKLVVE